MSFLINNSSRLVLGTVQFGLNYGIANTVGQPDQRAVDSIVNLAFSNGIYEFDTAQGYGESEAVLGNAINSMLNNNVRIISKISLDSEDIIKSKLKDKIFNSIKKLQVERLYGLMLHRQEQLEMWDSGLGEVLSLFVLDGFIQYLGVSVYTPERALQALNCENLNMIQIPANILDNRFSDAGVFEEAERLDKTIYIRSVFLQGLLLMKKLPQKMNFASAYHRKIVSLAKRLGVSVCELALWYIRDVFPKAKIVIGVDSSDQLQKNIDIWNTTDNMLDWSAIRREVGMVPQRIINPALW